MIKVEIINRLPKYEVPSDIASLVANSLKSLNVDNVLIEIEFVDTETIKELNLSSRNTDKPTDVLSFPLEQINPDFNILGNITVCPEIVSEKRENLDEVVRHGILHLCGFDHEIDENIWQEGVDAIGPAL